MLIIGEKINSSIASVAGAIERQDKEFIRGLAVAQAKAGADVIDVNAGAFLEREGELLPWLVEIVQEAVALPLCIDSPSPQALQRALAVCRRKAIVNSISLERDRYESILPLVKASGAAVMALCMDDRGIPATAAERLAVARRLVGRLSDDGLKPADIYVDVMAQPIGTDGQAGRVALDTVAAVRSALPGVHISCGLSNVSFGLPRRRLLNQAFAVAMATAGMDTMFIDPLDERMMALLSAAKALLGVDEYCGGYLGAYRAGRLG